MFFPQHDLRYAKSLKFGFWNSYQNNQPEDFSKSYK